MATRKPLPSISDAAWLNAPQLQLLMKTLREAGGEARVAGGAVRNHLMGEPVTEIDLATTLPPDRVMRTCKAAGFAVHPVGIEHGTVMIIVRGHSYEVTTLRQDVKTDGRRATVAFTAGWQADALRRDFTMNALYADAAGNLYDFTDGYKDIRNRKVRFVGEPRQRIKEDYLRILRFFRFHARYGKAAPDRAGLAACRQLRTGLKQLSAERIRQELLKLLVASRAVPALKAMSSAGILGVCLPHTEDWRTLEHLPADGLLRLVALAQNPRDLKRLLRLSNDEARRITLLIAAPHLSPKLREAERRRMLYHLGAQTWRDAAHLSHARSRAGRDDKAWLDLIHLPDHWPVPPLPVNGSDLIKRGLTPGPELGQALRLLEDHWIASDFQPTKEDLLRRLTT